MTRFRNALCAMVLCALSGCIHMPPVPDMSGAVASPSLRGAEPSSATIPFLFDDNRIFVEVSFVRPDGSTRKALAFVNMGFGAFAVTKSLYRELNPGPGGKLRVQFGTMETAIDWDTVQPSEMANSIRINFNPFSKTPTAEDWSRGPGGEDEAFFSPLPVEAVIPSGLLQHFQVAFDYREKTMTLAAPGTLKPEGIAVPIHLNSKTGFVTLSANIDGVVYPLVIDNGGSYTVFHSTSRLLQAHPGWLRSVGAVGEANYLMMPIGPEANTPVARIPNATIGGLTLEEFGVAQTDMPGWLAGLVVDKFWNYYSEKAGEKVEGWIGGNVLKSYRLTIDYANHMTYWLQQAPADSRDLDQIGVTLMRINKKYMIGGIALKDGKPTVQGVAPGDTLIQVDQLKTDDATRGQVLTALHGKPGERRHLVLERNSKRIEVDAVITAF